MLGIYCPQKLCCQKGRPSTRGTEIEYHASLHIRGWTPALLPGQSMYTVTCVTNRVNAYRAHVEHHPNFALHLFIQFSFFFSFFLSFFLVGAHHVACGILVPWPGMETGSSAVKAQSPNHWTSREFPIQFSILENPIYDSQNIKSPDVAILLCKQSCEIITSQKVERKQI